MHGRDCLDAFQEFDFKKMAEVANDGCLAAADEAYKKFVSDLDAQNADRADVQTRMLEIHLRQQEARIEGVRERHVAAGRTGLARAMQGQSAALKSRVERQRVKIEERRKMKDNKEEIAVGVIRVLEQL